MREASAAETGSVVRLMLDGGSNVHLMKHELLLKAGEVSPASFDVLGIGGATEVSDEIAVTVRFKGVGGTVSPPMHLNGAHAPGCRRDLLSESMLWDECGVRVLKEPVMQLLWDGGAAALQRENGLYFVDAVVSC